MIIEFFGISGVGKSTIAKKYIEESKDNIEWTRYRLYEQNGWFIRNVKKLICLMVFFITNLKWIILFNNILKKIKFRSVKDKYTILLNGMFCKYLLKKCKKKGQKYLFDEGTFQMIWAIYLRTNENPKKEIVEGLVELFGIPSELNIVVADSQIIEQRLKSRGRKTKILDSENLLSKIELMQKKMDAILNYSNSIIQRESCVVNYINNNREIIYEK